jgi:hypothetical protein
MSYIGELGGLVCLFEVVSGLFMGLFSEFFADRRVIERLYSSRKE